VNVDLNGVGQRKAEANPFSVPVSNETPGPKTGEGKKKKEKKKKDEKGHKWPPAIQAWIQKTEAATYAHNALILATTNYTTALKAYCMSHSQHYRDLTAITGAAFTKMFATGATAEDRANYTKAFNEEKRARKEIEPDFLKTPEGQQQSGNLNDAQKASDQANAEATDAGKGIDQETKDAVQQSQTQNQDKPASAQVPPPPVDDPSVGVGPLPNPPEQPSQPQPKPPVDPNNKPKP